jgi:hypothetical protein
MIQKKYIIPASIGFFILIAAVVDSLPKYVLPHLSVMYKQAVYNSKAYVLGLEGSYNEHCLQKKCATIHVFGRLLQPVYPIVEEHLLKLPDGTIRSFVIEAVERHQNQIKVDGQIIFDDSVQDSSGNTFALNYEREFRISDGVVVLVTQISGGNICEIGNYRMITVTSNEVQVSNQFGECAGIVTVTEDRDRIELNLTNAQYRYDYGAVHKLDKNGGILTY